MKPTLEDWLHARTENGLQIVCATGWDEDTNAAVLTLSDGQRMSFWRVTGDTVELVSDMDAAAVMSKLDDAQRKSNQ